VLVAARGTNELETTLNKTPGKDYIIGALAWIDRSVFRAGHITPGHATDQKDP
jgi:hypothetical protein